MLQPKKASLFNNSEIFRISFFSLYLKYEI